MRIETKGFTLMELLIVVAIIAILAAIAIPNFLEAQIRAKIIRSLQDMRTVSIGITAYEADHGIFPIATATGGGGYLGTPSYSQGWVIDYLIAEGDRVLHMGTLLTTPIRYLSKIPYDYFNSRSLQGSAWTPPNAQWSFIFSGLPPGGPRWTYNLLTRAFSMEGCWRWYLESVGPDLVWIGSNTSNSGRGGWFYDPSNGTISNGQLSFFDCGHTIPK